MERDMVWLGMRCQYFSGGPINLFIMQALIKEKKKFRSSLAQDITEVRKWKKPFNLSNPSPGCDNIIPSIPYIITRCLFQRSFS